MKDRERDPIKITEASDGCQGVAHTDQLGGGNYATPVGRKKRKIRKRGRGQNEEATTF